jgi:Na+-driven multidrug efflux pump
VGAVAALITVQTNLTIVLATGFVGRFGPAAIAGYGTGARLEYLLVPLIFGLGGPLVAMVGTNLGAGRRDRALRVAWIGAAIAAGLTELIGLCAAAVPHAWLSLFDTDPAVLDAGSRYLRALGPCYGLFGQGLALYFASQGAGRRLAGAALERRPVPRLPRPERGACRLRPDQRGSGREGRLVRPSGLGANAHGRRTQEIGA